MCSRLLACAAAIVAALSLAGPALRAQDTTISRGRALRVIDSAKGRPIAVALGPEAARTAGVSAAGFHERCAQRRLACITAEQFVTRPASHLSDFLVRTGAVKRRCDGSISQCVVSMSPSSGVGECSPSYFVDGVAFRVPPDVVLSELERLLPPSEILGIEIYRSEQRTPPELTVSTTCGVIAIWRR